MCNSIRRTLTCLSLFIALLCGVSIQRATAQNCVIEDFHSDITVNVDGSLLVLDTITLRNINAQSFEVISRYFRTQYPLRYSLRRLTPYSFLSVTCNEQPIPYKVINKADGVLLKIGEKNVLPPNNIFIYTTQYMVWRQLDFFPANDDLKWNVTGNSWILPISQVSATITLPAQITADQIFIEGNTLRKNEQPEPAVTAILEDGAITCAAASPLNPHEEFTLHITFPKGLVTEPSPSEEKAQVVQENFTFFGGVFTIGLLLLVYLLLWAVFGRNPETGKIHPLMVPPHNLSPAGLRYLRMARYDPKAFASALVSMAVKGLISIDELADRYTISLKSGTNTHLNDQFLALRNVPGNVLSYEEENLARLMFASKAHFTLQNDHAKELSSLIKNLIASLKKKFEHIYMNSNSWCLMVGIGIATLALIVLGYREASTASLWERARLLLGIVVLGAGGPYFSIYVFQTWHDVLSHKEGRLDKGWLIGKYALLVLAYLSFAIFLIWHASPPLWILLGIVIAVHFLLAHPLKAITMQGRTLLNEIEGFRMYLSGDHPALIAQLSSPEKTAELFERYLPYAMALDVEDKWAKQFTAFFSENAVVNSPITRWYCGRAWKKRAVTTLSWSLREEFAISLTPITLPLSNIPSLGAKTD